MDVPARADKMGSVVVEDVGTDITRYHPHTGMSDDLHDRERALSARRNNSNHRHTAQSSSYPYSSARQASAAAPQVSTQNVSTSFGYPTSQHHHQPASSRALESALAGVRPSTGNSNASTASSSSSVAETPNQSVEETKSNLPEYSTTDTPDAPQASPASPQLLPTVRSSLNLSQSSQGSPTRIKVRSLSHIHSFASEETLTRSQHGGVAHFELKKPGGAQYEISEMPVTDIIEMVAGLLTKITTTNDRQHQHENIHRHIPAPEGKSAVNQQTASVLSFHGKNVPSITILSYLSRIHKYCPTTYEVFISLLVYFDRMTETINKGTLSSFKSAAKSAEREIMSPSSTTSFQAEMLKAQASRDTTNPTLPTPQEPREPSVTLKQDLEVKQEQEIKQEPGAEEKPDKLAHCFIVDSFNIHRLVIAGVTCASKFFSDVFYTNSRYAKVNLKHYNYLCFVADSAIGWRSADS